MRRLNALRVRHRSAEVHRVSRVHGGVQGGESRAPRRLPDLGEVRRARDVSRHAPVLLRPALQPLRRRALRDHLPDRGPVSPRRRDRRLRRRPVHRLQVVHAGLSLRRALHRPHHADRGQVQLLRASGGGGSGAGLRHRLPGAGHRGGRPRRSGDADRAAGGHRAGAGAQARAGHPPEGVLSRRRRCRPDAGSAADLRALHVGAADQRGRRPPEAGGHGTRW